MKMYLLTGPFLLRWDFPSLPLGCGSVTTFHESKPNWFHSDQSVHVHAWMKSMTFGSFSCTLFTQLAATRSVLLIFIQRWCEERSGSVGNASWPQTTIQFMFTSSVPDKSWKVTPKHSPLVAGCSIVNKHGTLHLNKLDISQTKNQIALQIIFSQRCFMSF